MAFQYNVGYKSDITSKDMNDKIHVLIGKNSLISGFQITPGATNQIFVAPGSAVIQGCIITEKTDTMTLTLPISNVAGGTTYKIYLEYVHGTSSNDPSLCTLKYAENSVALTDNTLVIGTVFRAYQVQTITAGNITSVSETFESISTIREALDALLGDVVTTPTANKILRLNSVSKLPASITGNADGNAATASKLQTARTFAWTNDATGSGSFDGSGNFSAALTLAATGVAAGTYQNVTVDAKGRVTAGSNPTTLAGFGITDGLKKTGDTMTGDLTLYRDPTQAMHAATKQYVDNMALGIDAKGSVHVASTGNIAVTTETATTLTLTSALITMDGVTLAVGDRILLKDQTDGSQNGIYTYTSSTLLTRASDANSNVKVTPGMYAFVEEGTINADSGWLLTVNGTITIGTTVLTFVQFSGAGQVTAGTGLTKNGNTLALATSGATAGTYRSVTVDIYGRVTAGTNPTTLAGYGITDAAPSSHVGATGTAHGVATTLVNGFMSSADKTKLDGLSNYTHPNSGVTAGTYQNVTVNAQGHVTAGSNPTTVDGYGITDAVKKDGSVAMDDLTVGFRVGAIGARSTTSGHNVEASGLNSVSFGQFNKSMGLNSFTEGSYNVIVDEEGHVEGYSNLGSYGTIYNIIGFNNTAKTITLAYAGFLYADNVLDIKRTNAQALTDVYITAVNGNVITLATSETIDASWTFAVKRQLPEAPRFPIHIEGSNNLVTGNDAHAEGSGNRTLGNDSHVEGTGCYVSGDSAHAEGYANKAQGHHSHVEGQENSASGNNSHAEGIINTASGNSSHAEGGDSDAVGAYSHAEGYSVDANGDYSHAEGNSSLASGSCAHAEGFTTTASGDRSHAGGAYSVAAATHSFAHGYGLTANGVEQAVFGRYNAPSTTDLFQIGCGTSDSNRQNAFSVDAYGRIKANGLSEGFTVTIDTCTTAQQIYNVMTANPYSAGEGNVGNLDENNGLKAYIGNPTGFNNYTKVTARLHSYRVVELYAVGLYTTKLARGYVYYINTDYIWSGWMVLV
jgi:phage-related tail fiber protein